MFAYPKRLWRSIRRGSAGSRFREHHRREKKHNGASRPGPHIALGILLMIAGVILSIPPAVPGFIVTLLGAAIVASRSARAAAAFDRAEVWLRRILDKFMRKRASGSGRQ